MDEKCFVIHFFFIIIIRSHLYADHPRHNPPMLLPPPPFLTCDKLIKVVQQPTNDFRVVNKL